MRSAFSSSSTEAARSWVFCAAMTYVLPSLLQGCHILTYSIGIPQHCPGRRVRREGWRREGPHWHGCHSWKRCRYARSARPHQPGRSQDRPINLKYPQAHTPSAAIEIRPKRRREAMQREGRDRQGQKVLVVDETACMAFRRNTLWVCLPSPSPEEVERNRNCVDAEPILGRHK